METNLILDKGSKRFYDADGHLHVEASNISKAAVNPYLGNELDPDGTLGLDQKKVYAIFRPPEELEKAAATFNLAKLMSVHTPVSADDPKTDKVVGATGTDAEFVYPYLQNSLVIWDADAILGVETREKCELSCGYRYDIEMTPGTFEGAKYDGLMRNIVGNHVALVDIGRAGPSVVVGDAAIPKRDDVSPKEGESKYGDVAFADPKNKKYPIDTAEHVRSALSYWGKAKNKAKYKPKAQSAITARIQAAAKRFGIGQAQDKGAPMANKSFNPKRFLVMDRAAFAAGLANVLKPRLAKDASLEDLTDLLDELEDDDEGEGMGEDDGEEAMDALKTMMSGMDLAPDVREQVDALFGKLAKTKPKAKDESPAKKEEPQVEPKNDGPKAMDAASVAVLVQDAENKAVARVQAIHQALADVKPHVGIIAAMDSAEAVYKFALDAAEVDTAGVDASAYRAMVKMLPKKSETPVLAMDAAGSSSYEDTYHASRLRKG